MNIINSMMVQELMKLTEELSEEFRELCRSLGVEVSLHFHSLGLEESVVEKPNGKVYRYLQLKAVFAPKYTKTRSRTLKTYRLDEAPVEELKRLINLYRAIKHAGHLLNALQALDR